MQNVQTEITVAQDLLNENGTLAVQGWARSPLLRYDRSQVAAPSYRVVEQDSYFICSRDIILILTVGCFGLKAAACVTLINKAGSSLQVRQSSAAKFIAPSGTMMPASPLSGDVTFNNKRVGINFSQAAGKRFLKCEFINFFEGKNLYFSLSLKQTMPDYLSIAQPLAGRNTFYYAAHGSCMAASGTIKCGGEVYTLHEKDACATLTWSRGTRGKRDGGQIYACGLGSDGFLGFWVPIFQPGTQHAASTTPQTGALFLQEGLSPISGIAAQSTEKALKSPAHLASEDGMFSALWRPQLEYSDHALAGTRLIGSLDGTYLDARGSSHSFAGFTGCMELFA
ncbi:MAG TPA: DUF2804 family protein [Candidatus Gallacutalibacter stercoravium]|nr:DUF2804 family protein [Candidatus Gallacutalibacter stercoravium]